MQNTTKEVLRGLFSVLFVATLLTVYELGMFFYIVTPTVKQQVDNGIRNLGNALEINTSMYKNLSKDAILRYVKQTAQNEKIFQKLSTFVDSSGLISENKKNDLMKYLTTLKGINLNWDDLLQKVKDQDILRRIEFLKNYSILKDKIELLKLSPFQKEKINQLAEKLETIESIEDVQKIHTEIIALQSDPTISKYLEQLVKVKSQLEFLQSYNVNTEKIQSLIEQNINFDIIQSEIDKLKVEKKEYIDKFSSIKSRLDELQSYNINLDQLRELYNTLSQTTSISQLDQLQEQLDKLRGVDFHQKYIDLKHQMELMKLPSDLLDKAVTTEQLIKLQEQVNKLKGDDFGKKYTELKASIDSLESVNIDVKQIRKDINNAVSIQDLSPIEEKISLLQKKVEFYSGDILADRMNIAKQQIRQVNTESKQSLKEGVENILKSKYVDTALDKITTISTDAFCSRKQSVSAILNTIETREERMTDKINIYTKLTGLFLLFVLFLGLIAITVALWNQGGIGAKAWNLSFITFLFIGMFQYIFYWHGQEFMYLGKVGQEELIHYLASKI